MRFASTLQQFWPGGSPSNHQREISGFAVIVPIAKTRFAKKTWIWTNSPVSRCDIFGHGLSGPAIMPARIYRTFTAPDKNVAMFAATKSQDTKLEPGMRFRAREGGVWELRGLVNVQAKQPHVMLFDVHDHKITKVVSVNALLDTSLFRRLEPAADRKVPARATT